MEQYTIPAQLLQNVVNVLNELPSRVSRGLLNEIEATCSRQDAEAQTPMPVGGTE